MVQSGFREACAQPCVASPSMSASGKNLELVLSKEKNVSGIDVLAHMVVGSREGTEGGGEKQGYAQCLADQSQRRSTFLFSL